MKKLYFLIATILIEIAAHGQCSVTVTNHSNVTCNGSNNGSASVTTIGIPNYTYLWMPGGQTVQNPSNLAPATYTVTMTDANSCQATATVTITQPLVLSNTFTHTPVSCDSACDGSATATPAGGTSPYSYAWSNTQNSQTISALCAGMYSVTITDANGCTKADSILITQPAALGVSATVNNATCQSCSDGSATANVSGGTGPFSYMWSPGGQTTASLNNLSPGQYTVCVTDAHGCSKCDTIFVSYPTGMITLDGEYGISIYPNPAHNFINLEISSPGAVHVHATIRDVTGKIIFAEEYTSEKGVVKSYNFEQQSAGIYFMEMEIGDSRMTQKIIKY